MENLDKSLSSAPSSGSSTKFTRPIVNQRQKPASSGSEAVESVACVEEAKPIALSFFKERQRRANLTKSPIIKKTKKPEWTEISYCSKCTKTFVKASNLQRHITSAHGKKLSNNQILIICLPGMGFQLKPLTNVSDVVT
jgi:hypothetical protein